MTKALLTVTLLAAQVTQVPVEQIRGLPSRLAAIENRLDMLEQQVNPPSVVIQSPQDGATLTVSTHYPPAGEWLMVGYYPTGDQHIVTRPEHATDAAIEQWTLGWIYLDGVKVLSHWCFPENECLPPPGVNPAHNLTPDDPHQKIVRVWRPAQ